MRAGEHLVRQTAARLALSTQAWAGTGPRAMRHKRGRLRLSEQGAAMAESPSKSPKIRKASPSSLGTSEKAHRPSTKAETVDKPSGSGGWGSVGALAEILTQEEIF